MRRPGMRKLAFAAAVLALAVVLGGSNDARAAGKRARAGKCGMGRPGKARKLHLRKGKPGLKRIVKHGLAKKRKLLKKIKKGPPKKIRIHKPQRILKKLLKKLRLRTRRSILKRKP